MAEQYQVELRGLETFKAMEEMPAKVTTSIYRAINATADRGRADAARAMREQVNFPAGYLEQNERLRVAKRASAGNLEAKIVGRHRPTSLARFSADGKVGGRGGVSAQVKPGSARFMRRAFLIPLRAGTDSIETRRNLGLAIRLKPGEAVRNKKFTVGIGGGLYLLYAPSVDQVFNTVAQDIGPALGAYFETEFERLIALDL